MTYPLKSGTYIRRFTQSPTSLKAKKMPDILSNH